MFRRRDEDEVEYTLQPAHRNPAGSAFNATNQLPGQTITNQPAPTYTPNNTPYNPAAHSLAQAQSQQTPAEPPQKTYSSSAASAQNQNTAPETASEPQQAPKEKEPKTVTPKSAANMNTICPICHPHIINFQPKPSKRAKPARNSRRLGKQAHRNQSRLTISGLKPSAA